MLSFLAPNLFGFYQFVSNYLSEKLGYPTALSVGTDYAQLADADLAFVCSLPYVEHAGNHGSRLEPLAAPVLQGSRYAGRPIYFSDVIVRRDSPFHSFGDLRGRTWAYNEPHSQSGYGITRFHLVNQGETARFFGQVVEAGWHERAIQMVLSGEVDASAIDSHVLAVAVRRDPSLTARLRVIDTLGPSPIQPIVAGETLSRFLKEEIRLILVQMADDPLTRQAFDNALVDRFDPVTDATYDPIRYMLAATEAAGFLVLR